MNPFSALESDDEDETFTKVQSHKKTDSKKPSQAKNNNAGGNNSSAPAANSGNSEKKTNNRGGGGRGDNRNKGRGAGRGGKETGERGKHGKREYDRRSGTGRGNEVPKGGAGKGNWGSNEDEIAAQRRELEEGDVVVDKEKVEEPEEPVEPEVPTFTLDEFLAKRDAERSNSTVFKKVEERAVTDDFSNFKKGGEELDNFVVLGAGKTKGANASKAQRSTAQTKVTNLGFHSAPKEDYREDRGDRGGRGGRGDRGGKGGRGGRGGDRDRRSAPRAGGKVDINDQSAFPSL
mmetsp:Transcript_16500/g.27560  ORF Transcript_16500/g.27560 Transcript_16500/m.27560 type:complete len:290 (+) Transcript_16500:24-893(+)